MNGTQLLFFEETEQDVLRREMQEIRQSLDKIRKGQYAKIGQLAKMYQETHHELETLKAAMCRSEKTTSFLF